MSQKIQVDPARLEEDINILNNTLQNYLIFWKNVNNGLGSMMNALDPVLQRNIGSKMNKAMHTTSACGDTLGAMLRALRNCKETYEATDQFLAREYHDWIPNETLSEYYPEYTETVNNTANQKSSEDFEPLDVEYYMRNVTDAEYALLCHYWGLSANDKDPMKAFLKRIESLPENDPIRGLTSSNIKITNSPTGFSALTICDNNNAIVIFAGTNEDIGDYIADGKLTFNISPRQSKEAIALVDYVSKGYDNIVVTGHSLGGYLATAATLKNSAVDRCVAFDPPGRNDVLYQTLTNNSAVSKVTTYEALGSPISAVGNCVGNKIVVNVDGEDNLIRHGIKQISDSLGGVTDDTWSKNLTCKVER